MRLLPYGPRAVLAEFDSLAEVMAAATWWRASHLPGVVEVVPAARTVLICHDETFDRASLTAPAGRGVVVLSGGGAASVVIETAYDGADLGWIAEHTGLTPADVIALHSGATYTVAFCGFMPGFAYLVGLPPALHLPRRATPRTRVPAGAVAIADEFTGVYPRESPGGWHLVGRTTAVLWDDHREPPALLPPGTTVRFRPR